MATPKGKAPIIAPPPSNKAKTKPSIPEPDIPSQNLHKYDSNTVVQLKFDVDPKFKREFKTYAAAHDLHMIELLERAYEFYKAAHP